MPRPRIAAAGCHRGGVRTGGKVAVVVVAAIAVAGVAGALSRNESPAARTPMREIPTTTEASSPSSAMPVVPVDSGLASGVERAWFGAPGGCVSATRGRGVASVAPDVPVLPASVTKLLTGAVALDVLGPETRFGTVVVAEAAPVNGVVAGDLWLVGGGDPALATDEWAAWADTQRYTSLDRLADAVAAAGVRRVEGAIVGDESRFDAVRTVSSWPVRLVADGESGPLSALSINDGFTVWGHPGVPFADPPRDAATIFQRLLEQRGVEVGRGAIAGTATGSHVVARVDGPPVGDLVADMLADSDNETAELLVKELGRRWAGAGSTEAGAASIEARLGEWGLPMGATVVADGSGLSAESRVSCRLLTELLTFRESDLYPRLAVAGVSGTLARRYRGTDLAGRVRGKTGSLDGVAGIAGYADAPGGRVSFAIVLNGLPDGDTGRDVTDRILRALLDAP